MRFLFIDPPAASDARRLLDELGVGDVTVIVARPTGPSDEEIALLKRHHGAAAAAIGLRRKYRQCVAPLVQFCLEPKDFRFQDQPLRQWLVPAPELVETVPIPSQAFAAASAAEPRLVLCADALARADEVELYRHKFMARAADLLGRLARGEALGPPRDWKGLHGVDFAGGGRVLYRYDATCGHETLNDTADKHLKEGDHTTPQAAARVYFSRVRFSSGDRVVVFYVGPHPADGTYKASVVIPTTGSGRNP